MLKKLAKNIFVFSMLTFMFANFAMAVSDSVKAGLYGMDDVTTEVKNGTGGATGLDLKVNKSIPVIIGKIVGAALAFIGVLFFGLMLYGGFLWMTSRGNDDQVKKAIDLITNASIGFAIVAAAYILTRFVGDTIINSLATQ